MKLGQIFMRRWTTSLINSSPIDAKPVLSHNGDDEPIELAFNPYDKEPRKCILCKHQVILDYKNTRLLQQFVSSFSGRVYDRHITGLCNEQHDILLKTIAMSRKAGYMPILTKNPKFLRDPKLFDPLRPVRSHSFA